MATPNIDAIAASLRSCSLADPEAAKLRASAGTPASKGASGDAADIALDLNSDLALPCHWEQFLDLKTGRLYYINRSSGARTTEDPRKYAGSYGGYESGDQDEEDDDGDDADDEDEPDDDDSSEGGATAAQSDVDGSVEICSPTVSSSSSSGSSREEDAVERGAPVLVAAGCRGCMMYVMIPKGAEECPRCRGHVICFGRSGSR